jgi:hypothetical protein
VAVTRSVKKIKLRRVKRLDTQRAKKAVTPAKGPAKPHRLPTRRPIASSSQLASLDVREIESLRTELKRLSSPPRWNADPEDVRRSVAKLVLTLIEFIRQVLERQAIRRMDAGTLTPEETEKVGLALMRLEETIRDLAAQFGLRPEELNLDLGPIGKLV